MEFMNGNKIKISGGSIAIFTLATISLILPNVLVNLRVNLSSYS